MQETGKTLDPELIPSRKFTIRDIYLRHSETIRLVRENITAMFGLVIIAGVIIISIFAPFIATQHPTPTGGWPQDLTNRFDDPNSLFLILVTVFISIGIIQILLRNRFGTKSTELVPRVILIGTMLLVFFVAVLAIILWIQAKINGTFLLGSDLYGRDVFSRLIYGSRVSIKVGLISVGLALLLGIPLGVLAAYYGGTIDLIISRVMDILFSFPGIILAILVLAALGNGLTQAMVAIGIAITPNFGRLIRSSALSIKEQEYMQAAKSAGASDFDIMRHHLLPNSVSPIIVQATLSLAGAIIAEASLSFLGLGVQPPTPTWGYMMNYGLDYLRVTPWMCLFSGLAITITVLGFNMFGDGLRDAVDPRLKRER